MFHLDRMSNSEEDRSYDDLVNSPYTLKLWNGFSNDEFTSPQAEDWRPAVRVYEDERYFVVDFELTGVDIPGVEVNIREDSLILRGEKRLYENDAIADAMASDWLSEPVFFEGAVALPGAILKEDVCYDLQNSILTIYLPKVESSAPKPIAIHFTDASFDVRVN